MDPTSIGITVGALTVIFSLFWLMSKIVGSFRDSIEKDYNEKLKANKEYTDIKHAESLREIEHIKEVQNGKLEEMSKKIDDLREQLQKGQEQTMEILTQLLTRDQ